MEIVSDGAIALGSGSLNSQRKPIAPIAALLASLKEAESSKPRAMAPSETREGKLSHEFFFQLF
jgi:hypothetical protein